MQYKSRRLILFSPFIIIAINFAVAYIFGQIIGKWSFIPIIIIEWILFIFIIYNFGGRDLIKNWLKKADGKWFLKVLCIIIGLIPLPIFLKYNHVLIEWQVWIPWIIIALINPWLEEFYWRGILLDATKNWNSIISVIVTSNLFSANHLVFGVNSALFRGPEIFISTFIMGIVWAVTYKKTSSLRWVIFSHFLVDFLNLSAPAFLEMIQPAW